MLAYKLHNTVFLVRRENSPTELIPDVRGYGHAFPKANTAWEADVKGSASHQRLVRYDFGGLDLVVRFGADGYIKPAGPATPPSLTTIPATLSDLTSSLSTTTITPQLSAQTNNTSPTPTSNTLQSTLPPSLTIQEAGTLTPSTALFDLKTRSIHTRHRKDHLAEDLPRLWVSQIPNFILAFHTSGLFKTEDTEIRDVRGDVARWEQECRSELGRLAALLHWVRRQVDTVNRATGGTSSCDSGEEVIEICHCLVGGAGQGVLEVRRPGGDITAVVSERVRERWVKAGRRGGIGREEDGDTVGDDGKSGARDSREKGADAGKGVGGRTGDKIDEVQWEESDEDFTACGEAWLLWEVYVLGWHWILGRAVTVMFSFRFRFQEYKVPMHLSL
jgi:hypothetical protein